MQLASVFLFNLKLFLNGDHSTQTVLHNPTRKRGNNINRSLTRRVVNNPSKRPRVTQIDGERHHAMAAHHYLMRRSLRRTDLPLRSRKKYSLARRITDLRLTSILSIRGE